MHHTDLFEGNSLDEVALPEHYKQASPDVIHVVAQTLRIDDVRNLIDSVHRRPYEGGLVVYILQAQVYAHEAQHALLKILEEPPSHVHLCIVVPRADSLLPTVLSRVQIHRTCAVTRNVSVEMDEFLHRPFKERLDCIAKKVKDKDTEWILAIVGEAEVYASGVGNKDLQLANMILMVRRYIALQGASKKMLLEGLALQMPLRN